LDYTTASGVGVTLEDQRAGVGYEFAINDTVSANVGLGSVTGTASAAIGTSAIMSFSMSTTYYKVGVSADISEKTSVSVGLVDATSSTFQMETLFNVSHRISDEVGLMLSASNSSLINLYGTVD
jgi:hypothetical protein